MPLAPLADPWSKKMELKEDLEVIIIIYGLTKRRRVEVDGPNDGSVRYGQ